MMTDALLLLATWLLSEAQSELEGHLESDYLLSVLASVEVGCGWGGGAG